MCIYYKALNKVTIKIKYPFPLVEELLDELGGLVIFFKIGFKIWLSSNQNEGRR